MRSSTWTRWRSGSPQISARPMSRTAGPRSECVVTLDRTTSRCMASGSTSTFPMTSPRRSIRWARSKSRSSQLREQVVVSEVRRWRSLVSVGNQGGRQTLMIQPQDLLDHAKALVPDSERRPKEIDLRRGVSAAYYSVFHHMTEKAAHHLIGGHPRSIKTESAETRTHGVLQRPRHHG